MHSKPLGYKRKPKKMYGKKLNSMKLEGGPLPETKQRLPAGVLTALMAGSSQELAPGVSPWARQSRWIYSSH